jgi:hypothetical protein
MVERMLADGAPALAIVAAVRAVEGVTAVTRDVTLSSRDASRIQSRIRSKNYRDSKKIQRLAGEAKANDVADRHAIVTRDAVTDTLSPSVVLLPSLLVGETLEERKKDAVRVRARGTRLSPGAPLTDEHRAVIVAEGIQDPDRLWAEFVDYWSDIPGQRGCKISWTGTLRNRCRDVIKRGFQLTGAKNGRRTVHDAARELHEQTVAAVLAFDEPAPRGLRDGTGSDVVRLLPPR